MLLTGTLQRQQSPLGVKKTFSDALVGFYISVCGREWASRQTSIPKSQEFRSMCDLFRWAGCTVPEEIWQRRGNLGLVDQKIYQTLKNVFSHISKHREECWKCDALETIFNWVQGIWNVIKHFLSVWNDIFSQWKLKLRKNGEINS